MLVINDRSPQLCGVTWGSGILLQLAKLCSSTKLLIIQLAEMQFII
jgi:hypothetical protein